MPLTLYRYMFKELARLLAMVTVALVVVMAVAMAIKPVSEGALAPGAVVKLFIYLMPGMLTYALPVAAAFSATMVYFRMAGDNEITACAVSGISYRSLLLPAAVMGLALTLGMFFLANYMIPYFWQKAEKLGQRGVAKIIVDQLNSGAVFRPPGTDYIVYADGATIKDIPKHENADPTKPQLFQWIKLDKPAVAKSEPRTGKIEAEYTGNEARLLLYRQAYTQQTYVVVELTDATINDPKTNLTINVEQQKLGPHEIVLPFEQKPQFMSRNRLEQVANHPEENLKVIEKSDDLLKSLSELRALRRVREIIADDRPAHPLVLYGPLGERCTITAPRVALAKDQAVLNADGDRKVTVRVTREQDGKLLRWMRAESAIIEAEQRTRSDEPRLTLELTGVTVNAPELPTPTDLASSHLKLLRLPEKVAADLREARMEDLIARGLAEDDESIRKEVDRLNHVIESLRREIYAAINERAAMAVCTMMVMLLGAVMSMHLRQQVALVIFFWCFVPAIIAIVAINGGENVITSHDFHYAVGVVATWAGIVGLLGLIGFIYARLSKN